MKAFSTSDECICKHPELQKLGTKNTPLSPVADAPPSFPTPQSPYNSATSSRTILARRPGVNASEVGEWMASCADCGLFFVDWVVVGHVFGSG